MAGQRLGWNPGSRFFRKRRARSLLLRRSRIRPKNKFEESGSFDHGRVGGLILRRLVHEGNIPDAARLIASKSAMSRHSPSRRLLQQSASGHHASIDLIGRRKNSNRGMTTIDIAQRTRLIPAHDPPARHPWIPCRR
jgi:hypothetical protein